MKYLIFIFVLLSISKTFGQTVDVEFLLENKIQKLNDDFLIYFIWYEDSNKYIIKPKIRNNSFVVPDLKGAKKGNLVFINKKYTVGCNIDFNFNQKTIFRFGFDKKPYDENYTIEDRDHKNIKAISYLMLIPEHGVGTVTAVSITNIKKYNLSCNEAFH